MLQTATQEYRCSGNRIHIPQLILPSALQRLRSPEGDASIQIRDATWHLRLSRPMTITYTLARQFLRSDAWKIGSCKPLIYK